jgi:hypothetical protein
MKEYVFLIVNCGITKGKKKMDIFPGGEKKDGKKAKNKKKAKTETQNQC